MKRWKCIKCDDNLDRGWTVGNTYIEDDRGLIDDDGYRRLWARSYNDSSMMRFIEINFNVYLKEIESDL